MNGNKLLLAVWFWFFIFSWQTTNCHQMKMSERQLAWKQEWYNSKKRVKVLTYRATLYYFSHSFEGTHSDIVPSTVGFRCGCPTSDHAPVLHWAGQDTRLQGRRLSGFSPLQYLLWTERLVPSWRNCTQRTVRIWKPRLPQDLGQCSHSSVIHLDAAKWGNYWN